jgi:hypothetical protein
VLPSTSTLHPFRTGLFAAVLASAALASGCTATSEPTGDLEDSGEAEGAASTSVASAVANSCSTASVKGLSQQIIAEARCMVSGAYSKVSDLGNVSFGSAVFPYMVGPARDRLHNALNNNKGKFMTVNSMLRTISQQYLLYRWYQTGRCGIGLAAKPGASNHETGLAIDISQYSTWKGTLQAYGFKWLGSSDPVHFDYAGSGATNYKGLDVKAFQRLWNRNHPGDKISVDGAWGPQTEARMKQAPAGGFAKGASCGSQSFEDDYELAAVDESDLIDLQAVDLTGAFEAAVSEDIADDDHDHLSAHAVNGPITAPHETHVGSATITQSDAECATCFDAICATDAYCCETEWDDRCVQTGLTLCEALCGKEAMSPLP